MQSQPLLRPVKCNSDSNHVMLLHCLLIIAQ